MKKIILQGSLLATVLMSGAAMATDFHALTGVQAAPTSIENAELSAIEGGATCSYNGFVAGGIVASEGGVALCAFLASGASGGTASFTVANELPVTGAQFLQVVN
ncbi:MAG: hypothetical protein V3V18_03955 [Methylococcales bacterium]